MQPGIFARTFDRPTLGGVLDAVKAHDLHSVQFSMVSAGIPSLPEEIPPDLTATIRREMAVRGMKMAALSGTFNMIHPDPRQRQDGLRRLQTLALACAPLEVSVVTLCTGSRDPDNMWRRHPENDSPEAWQDLLTAMEQAVQIAEETGITLGVEPELANVVNSARKARRLLDEMASPRLKIIMDGANLLHADQQAYMPAIFDEAFALLADDIVIAHAKDLSPGEGFVAAGAGILDYDYYLALLHQAAFSGPLILHSLTEEQVGQSVRFLHQKLWKS